jgi:hypothetical protein
MLDLSCQDKPVIYFGLRCSWWGTIPQNVTAATPVPFTQMPGVGITEQLKVCPHCSGPTWRVHAETWFEHLGACYGPVIERDARSVAARKRPCTPVDTASEAARFDVERHRRLA